MKPTICFATVCKDEAHIIKSVLNSVYKHISYWVICDTGSTDETQKIIIEFFKEKNILGELFVDEWVGFGANKTLMMERAKGKADYILHFDADDILMGNFNFTKEDVGWDIYNFSIRRASLEYKSSLLYKGDYSWKFCGVAHTTIKCLDKPNYEIKDLSNKDYYLLSEDVGFRSTDPNKYIRDAEKIKQQFFNTLLDDPDELNVRSVFYTAQSYMDAGEIIEALKWNRLYTKLKNTWIEEDFEANLRIAACLIYLNKPSNEIIQQLKKTIEIFPDRSEPYLKLGQYLNVVKEFTEAYKYLKQAEKNNLKEIKKKYILFVDEHCYGKYLKDELSVSCYWLEKYDEGLELLNEIVDDSDFIEQRPRLLENIQHFINKINEK